MKNLRSSLCIFLAFLLLMLCAACGGPAAESTPPAGSDPVESVPVESDPAQTDPAQTDPVQPDDTDDHEDDHEDDYYEDDSDYLTDEDIAAHLSSAPLLASGDVCTADGVARFTLDSAYWAKEILPDDTSGPYNYMGEAEGCTYLVCRGTIENLSEDEIRLSYGAGDITNYLALAEYNGAYYLGGTEAAEPDHSSITSWIDAGVKTTLYVFFSIPNELVDPNASVSLLFGFDDFSDSIFSNVGFSHVDWDACRTLIRADFTGIPQK